MTEKIILASGSPFRKAMLINAGLGIEAVPADVDERALEAPLQDSGVSPEDVALILAQGDRGQRTQTGRPGARLRPDFVTGR
jgi:septum formation protein